MPVCLRSPPKMARHPRLVVPMSPHWPPRPLPLDQPLPKHDDTEVNRHLCRSYFRRLFESQGANLGFTLFAFLAQF